MDTLIRQGDGFDKSSPYKKLHDKMGGQIKPLHENIASVSRKKAWA
jgi:hypothetical protein